MFCFTENFYLMEWSGEIIIKSREQVPDASCSLVLGDPLSGTPVGKEGHS